MGNQETQLIQLDVLLNSVGCAFRTEKKDKKLILYLNHGGKLIIEEKNGHRGTDWDTWTEVRLIDNDGAVRAKLEL